MSSLFFILLLLFFSIRTQAQNHTEPCGFHILTNTKEVVDFEVKIAKELAKKNVKNQSSTTAQYVIPVVVHIIHNGGIENISDAQILSQIQILNEDFRKIAGTNGDGAGVDTKIEFHLAQITPSGRCTNGIVRIKSLLTNHQTYQRSLLKDLSFWNPDKYLNIYVVNSINSGILGYASFPSGPADADGVVVRDDAFGNIGTVQAGSNLGRTLTHEIAHWFGLYHTFQDGCGVDTCTDGDKVCDTPPVASPNYGCPSSVNSCSNDVPNLADQIQNYADYTDDACKSMFTAGQRDRMEATLNTVRTNIWSYSNLIATGTDSAYVAPSICPVIADFTVAKADLCINSNVSFTSRSLNSPTNYLWTFIGGTPSSSTLENPTVLYSTVGIFSVQLKVWNTLSQDSVIINNFITVTTPSSGATLGINEGFENAVFPWSGLNINNPDSGVTWERTTLASYQGNASIRINNLINTNYGQNDDILFPSYDFTTFVGTPYLRFKWAYVRSDPSYSDELIVLASKNCGLNWQQVFYRAGNSLATGATQTTEYIPDSNTVWKTANINLGAYATETNVLLKIVNVTDGGNCLYLDNINMGDTSLIFAEINTIDLQNEVSIYPNPTTNFFTIKSTVDLKGSTISIFNIQGQLTQQQTLLNENENSVALSHLLVSGVYFIEIKNKNVRIYKKLIKS